MVENWYICYVFVKLFKNCDWIVVIVLVKVVNYEIFGDCGEVILDDGCKLLVFLIVGCDGKFLCCKVQSGICFYGWNYGQNGVVVIVEYEELYKGVVYEYFMLFGFFVILLFFDNCVFLVWIEGDKVVVVFKVVFDEVFQYELENCFGDFLGKVCLVGLCWVYLLGLWYLE